MTRERLDGLYLFLLGSLLFLAAGAFLAKSEFGAVVDFKGIYYDTRCLLQHIDPYVQGEPLRFYKAETGVSVPPFGALQPILALNAYLPTTFIFIAPFALLPWAVAYPLSDDSHPGQLPLGAFLMWDMGADYAPAISGALVAFCVVNNAGLFLNGNWAGVVIGFCAIAVWCFFKERFVAAGIFCLAVSLAIKPHEAGLLWMFFLLSGGVYRKRALQTLALTALLGVPAILWVWQVAPHWMQELHSNLAVVSAHGGLNDPGPNGMSSRTGAMVIDLQSVVSVFWDDARIYNPASYLVCGALLLAWSIRTVRSRTSAAKGWLALAAIVPLTLLATYHRPYDSRLLLLSVPACAMLWAEGKLAGWLALLGSTAAIAMTGIFRCQFYFYSPNGCDRT